MGKLAAVVVAGGRGSRMGTAESKQYLLLDRVPILVHTLLVFEKIEEVDTVVVVVGSGDEPRVRQYAADFGLRKVQAIVAGGGERQASVHNGLRRLGDDVEWVLVHDAVRPFVRPEDILACWRGAFESGGAVLAVPVKDTIKVVDPSGWIQSTPDRRSLWAIQTPQAFRLSALREAYEAAERSGFVATDDAMVAEKFGLQVRAVPGSYSNIKITTPEDLLGAEETLRRNGEARSDNGDKE